MRRLLEPVTTAVFAIGVILLSFNATAFAADQVSPTDGSLIDLARPLFDAVMHKQWWVAASAAVVLLCSATRRYMPDAWKTGIKGDIVGMATAFLLAFAGAIGTWAVAPGATMSLAVLATATKVGFVAIGGYTALHKFATWAASTKWFQNHAPAWLVAATKLVLALVGSNALSKAQTQAEAEKAGEDAVEAKPSTGIGGVLGNPTEIE